MKIKAAGIVGVIVLSGPLPPFTVSAAGPYLAYGAAGAKGVAVDVDYLNDAAVDMHGCMRLLAADEARLA